MVLQTYAFTQTIYWRYLRQSQGLVTQVAVAFWIPIAFP